MQGRGKDKKRYKVRDSATEIETKTGRNREKQTRGERIETERKRQRRRRDHSEIHRQTAILKVETPGLPHSEARSLPAPRIYPPAPPHSAGPGSVAQPLPPAPGAERASYIVATRTLLTNNEKQ